MTSGGVLHAVIDDNVGEFNWRQGDSSSMSLLPELLLRQASSSDRRVCGAPLHSIDASLFFEIPDCIPKKYYHL